MPYLEYLFCDDCGEPARLDIDPGATIDEYNKEGRESSAINQATFIWDYLVYVCVVCGRRYKYTYRDVEEKVRKHFSSISQEHKKYFDELVSKAEDREIEAIPEAAISNRIEVAKRIKSLYEARKK